MLVETRILMQNLESETNQPVRSIANTGYAVTRRYNYIIAEILFYDLR